MKWFKTHIVFVSVLVYILFVWLLFLFKPAFLFQTDGSLREFGVAYKNKTIFPFWLLCIFTSILIYIGTQFVFSKIK